MLNVHGLKETTVEMIIFLKFIYEFIVFPTDIQQALFKTCQADGNTYIEIQNIQSSKANLTK